LQEALDMDSGQCKCPPLSPSGGSSVRAAGPQTAPPAGPAGARSASAAPAQTAPPATHHRSQYCTIK